MGKENWLKLLFYIIGLKSENFSFQHFKDGRHESLRALAPNDKMAALVSRVFLA